MNKEFYARADDGSLYYVPPDANGFRPNYKRGTNGILYYVPPNPDGTPYEGPYFGGMRDDHPETRTLASMAKFVAATFAIFAVIVFVLTHL